MGLGLWFGTAVALAAPSWTSPEPGQFHLGAHSGFPWNGVSAEYAPRSPLAITGQVTTALFKRTEARIGLQRPWGLSENWSAVTAISAGAVHQIGGVPRQGPQFEGRLAVSRTGRVEPYLSVHSRELWALESVQTQSNRGEETAWTGTRYSSRGGSLGMLIPAHSQWCIDLAISAGSMDSEFSIPSLTVGLDWRPKP